MTTRSLTTLLLALMTCALAGGESAGAAISREDLKKVLDANPDLALDALKKADKMKFFEFVVEAQQEYQKRKAKEEQEREQKEREDAFKNPLKPEIAANARVRGPKDAPITIVEYSDFQCPYCKQGHANVETLRNKYGEKLRFVFKNMPLSFHAQALPAAQWFEAVAMQSPEKAWVFHNSLFENQDKLSADYYKKLTNDLGLDAAKAAKDASSEAVKSKIEADIQEAKKFGIEGTPAYLINGVPLRGAYPIGAFDEIIAKFQAAR